MRPKATQAVPTLTEVLEPLPVRPAPTAAEAPPAISEEALRQLIAEALDACVAELREQLRPRVEARVREALARRWPAAAGEA
ncbi:hypothetical protein [Roseateles violae]|uniref:Uncharacterized protein n=1 Tax=Roseateles violae TaxID=3058042 RepID=A0ABT8DTS4_9BURK|nr:hypothetical protein [Pelomonas sp. PFR6]MDN3920430.1 hypothetical protein [Pelomonas sp. PFR6]